MSLYVETVDGALCDTADKSCDSCVKAAWIGVISRVYAW